MQRKVKLIGMFALLLGAVAVSSGISIWIGGSPAASEGLSCKAICGITLLIAEFFGDTASTFAAGLLWIFAGIPFVLVGYLLLRESRGS